MLTGLADRLSCAVFGLANTVTAMFYAIESSTAGLVEGGVLTRPQWLQLAVHLGNSGVAWADLFLVEERSFCGRSRHLATGLGLLYALWLLLVRGMYGKVGAEARVALGSVPVGGEGAGAAATAAAGAPAGAHAASPCALLQFPYPIMNKLPFPAGFVGFFAVGMSVVIAAFELGALVKRGGRGRGRRPKTD